MRHCRRYGFLGPRLRRGMSSLELVMTTAVMVPMAAALFFLAAKGAKIFYQMVCTVVGWPHL